MMRDRHSPCLRQAVRSAFTSPCLLFVLLTGIPLASAAQNTGDITDIPFEKLLETDVITAARLAKQVSDAPSAVSIVTAQEIRQYGYRSLADILNGMRGLYVSQGPQYGLLGGRGYGAPADYAGRVTVLINGYKAQDNYWGQSFFGADGLLDVELIERVEYIPGPGSSSHGDSAFMGVVNIITRQGRDLDGFTLSKEWGSHGWEKNRLTYGKQFDSGLDLVFSVSDYHRDGRIPFDDQYQIRYENEQARRYFVQAAYGDWQFSSGWARRSPFNGGYDSTDTNAFASLKHDGTLDEGLRLSTHAYWGQYRYTDKSYETWGTIGSWAGLDVKLVNTRHEDHTLVVGAEYRSDYQQDFEAQGYGTQHVTRQTTSLYAYDNIRLNPFWQLNLGARLDRRDNGSRTLSPRGAFTFTPREGRTFKLSTGIAHRQTTPNFESYAPESATAMVERLRTSELVWEEQLAPRTRLLASLYRYRLDNSYGWDRNWAFTAGKVQAQGQELELEHVWEGGTQLRGSFTRQEARDTDGFTLSNVPHRVAKLNFSTPIWGEKLRLGTASRYISGRNHLDGEKIPGGTITDLTLSGRWQACSFIFSARNVFNKTYQDISNAGLYPLDGRNYWLQLNLELK